MKALKDAKEGLTFVPVAPVSKEVLSGLIKTAEGLDAQLYTKDSYQALTKHLTLQKQNLTEQTVQRSL